MGHRLCSLCIPFLYQKTEFILERRRGGEEEEKRRGEGEKRRRGGGEEERRGQWEEKKKQREKIKMRGEEGKEDELIRTERLHHCTCTIHLDSKFLPGRTAVVFLQSRFVWLWF